MGKPDRGRPTGTVSFLFTDIEGSTPLWEQHPDAMRGALERHDAILRRAIEGHRGFVFSTAGDAFSAAFWTPDDAVGAVLEAQRALQGEDWPDEAQLKVRMGVHSGTVQERDGDYFGSAVNRAARLMGLAHGGQVLVSLAVEELVRDDLPEGVGLKGLGEHDLKGLSRPETVFQLTAPDLVGEFALLAAGLSVPTNLPSTVAGLIGRDTELAALAEELGSARLVSLVGPGGVGKTTLALEVARRVRSEYRAGVWVLELAPIRDPDAVVAALASVVGVRAGEGSLLEVVLELLGTGPSLVVVDNCEHLADAAAGLVASLLSVPSVRVLVTSRVPLHLRDERVWAVAPLVFEGAGSAAVELFVERARQVRRDFSVSDDATAAAVEAICGLVDGMPLAVELAAARCRSMTPADILAALERDAGRVLRSTRRDSEERQRTLAATIGWSYDLLDPVERVLFGRLSVFAGTFDLAAAEAVCGGGEVDELDVIDLLDSLVDQSMMVLVDQPGSPSARFRLLEPIRQCAQALVEDPDGLAGLHAGYFASLVAENDQRLFGPDEVDAWVVFDTEWDNIRAAVGHSIDVGDLDRAGELITGAFLYAFYAMRSELGDWARALLARPGIPDEAMMWQVRGVRAWALWSAAGDLAGAADLFERAVARGAVDPRFWSIGSVTTHVLLGDFEGAARAAGVLLAAVTDARGAFLASLAQSFASDRADTEEAVEWVDRALEVAAAAGHVSGTAYAQMMKGRMLRYSDPVAAHAASRSAIDLASALHPDHYVVVQGELTLAQATAASGEIDEALRCCRDAVAAVLNHRSTGSAATALHAAAVAINRAGDAATASRVADGLVRNGYQVGRRLRTALVAGLGDRSETQDPTVPCIPDLAGDALAAIDALLDRPG